MYFKSENNVKYVFEHWSKLSHFSILAFYAFLLGDSTALNCLNEKWALPKDKNGTDCFFQLLYFEFFVLGLSFWSRESKT